MNDKIETAVSQCVHFVKQGIRQPVDELARGRHPKGQRARITAMLAANAACDEMEHMLLSVIPQGVTAIMEDERENLVLAAAALVRKAIVITAITSSLVTGIVVGVLI